MHCRLTNTEMRLHQVVRPYRMLLSSVLSLSLTLSCVSLSLPPTSLSPFYFLNIGEEVC